MGGSAFTRRRALVQNQYRLTANRQFSRCFRPLVAPAPDFLKQNKDGSGGGCRLTLAGSRD